MTVEDVKRLAERAGLEIMKYYRSGNWAPTMKADDSPVTEADLASNAILVDGLRSLDSNPVISEESDPFSVSLSQSPERKFWLIDPLDGTRDFIDKKDTFVISIGLVLGEEPVFGLIHLPVTGETWWAEKGKGAFGPGDRRISNASKRTQLIATTSRSETNDRMKVFREEFSVGEVQQIGSALKFCRLAEGAVDLYPRFGAMYEWDTAAGQIIAEEAGCRVLDLTTGSPLRYGKPGLESRSGFVASRGDLDLLERIRNRFGSLG
jgi:3'(2'), 5'-bisphosphate nucleotidase